MLQVLHLNLQHILSTKLNERLGPLLLVLQQVALLGLPRLQGFKNTVTQARNDCKRQDPRGPTFEIHGVADLMWGGVLLTKADCEVIQGELTLLRISVGS